MILTKGLGSYIFPIKHEQPNPEVYTSIIDEIMALFSKKGLLFSKNNHFGAKKAFYYHLCHHFCHHLTFWL